MRINEPLTKVRDNGVVVLVPRYGIEGIVHVCEVGESNPFTFDEKQVWWVVGTVRR